jgi:hypothetical protein
MATFGQTFCFDFDFEMMRRHGDFCKYRWRDINPSTCIVYYLAVRCHKDASTEARGTHHQVSSRYSSGVFGPAVASVDILSLLLFPISYYHHLHTTRMSVENNKTLSILSKAEKGSCEWKRRFCMIYH